MLVQVLYVAKIVLGDWAVARENAATEESIATQDGAGRSGSDALE